MKLRLLVTNVPDLATGKILARALVEEHLVACVNLLPGGTSIYRWQGARPSASTSNFTGNGDAGDGGPTSTGVLEEAEEVTFVAKTTHARLSAAIARLCELHPYEVPEVLSLDADASEPYGQWVEGAVGETTDGEPKNNTV